MAKLQDLPAKIGSMKELNCPHTAGFHGEIDAAVEFTQRGQPDVTLVQLDVLRKQHWDELSHRERFRLIANIGHAYNAKDQYREAARHFIDCRTFQPDDEQGWLPGGNRTRNVGGFRKPSNSRKPFARTFQTLTWVGATWIRNAPDDWSVATLEERTPTHVRASVERAIGFLLAGTARGRFCIR